MKRQQRVDAFIDSYKRKRHAAAAQTGAGTSGGVSFCSLSATSPDTGALVVLPFQLCTAGCPIIVSEFLSRGEAMLYTVTPLQGILLGGASVVRHRHELVCAACCFSHSVFIFISHLVHLTLTDLTLLFAGM